jgi:hypothetical protein
MIYESHISRYFDDLYLRKPKHYPGMSRETILQ